VPSFRQVALASLAAVVGLSLASAASGETGNAASDPPPAAHPHAASASPRKKPARTKRKKQRHTTTTLTPRTGGRLTLAASADVGGVSSLSAGRSAVVGESLVDESQLPPATGGSCPAEMASIDRRFCIDRWEASLIEIDPVHGERPFSPFLVVDGHEVRAVSARGVFPQGYVSGAQAEVACERAGKRLCSPMEWRKACIGPEPKLYGYAESHEHGRCNDSARSPMLAIWGSTVLAEPSGWDPLKMNDPRLNQLEGALARTGSHSGCTNDYGVYDMVGNLHEWTSDPNGTFQGGYYLDTSINGEGCSYRTTAHDFDYHDYSTGFRCCASPR
jgi:formylglycine-generating enzyme